MKLLYEIILSYHAPTFVSDGVEGHEGLQLERQPERCHDMFVSCEVEGQPLILLCRVVIVWVDPVRPSRCSKHNQDRAAKDKSQLVKEGDITQTPTTIRSRSWKINSSPLGSGKRSLPGWRDGGLCKTKMDVL